MIRWGKPKRYLKSGTRPQDFFKHLNNAGVRYLLLRWWKSFPQIDRGEDLDILVHADDYRKIEALLSSTPSELKCDVFTHDGTQSHRKFKGPYFPPSLASDLLKTRVLYQQSVFVPSEQLYFASLAYHAVFHKGAAGGLRWLSPRRRWHLRLGARLWWGARANSCRLRRCHRYDGRDRSHSMARGARLCPESGHAFETCRQAPRACRLCEAAA